MEFKRALTVMVSIVLRKQHAFLRSSPLLRSFITSHSRRHFFFLHPTSSHPTSASQKQPYHTQSMLYKPSFLIFAFYFIILNSISLSTGFPYPAGVGSGLRLRGQLVHYARVPSSLAQRDQRSVTGAEKLGSRFALRTDE